MQTTHGLAPTVKFETKSEDGAKESGTLILPNRLLAQCQTKLPCVAYYAGKKQLKGGKSCHDIHFISDTEDEDEEIGDDDIYEIGCKSCRIKKVSCFGFCGGCGCHQPPDGSQCVC